VLGDVAERVGDGGHLSRAVVLVAGAVVGAAVVAAVRSLVGVPNDAHHVTQLVDRHAPAIRVVLPAKSLWRAVNYAA